MKKEISEYVAEYYRKHGGEDSPKMSLEPKKSEQFIQKMWREILAGKK